MDDHIVSTDDIYITFDSTFAPMIKKYQVRRSSAQLGNYLAALAQVASIPEAVHSHLCCVVYIDVSLPSSIVGFDSGQSHMHLFLW